MGRRRLRRMRRFLPLARALLIQDDFRGVLQLAESDAGLDLESRSELAVVRLQAEFKLGLKDPFELRRGAEPVIRSLDSAREAESWSQLLLEQLEELGSEDEVMAAALEHARCRRQAVESYAAGAAVEPGVGGLLIGIPVLLECPQGTVLLPNGVPAP